VASPHTPLIGLALFACLQGCWLYMTVDIANNKSNLHLNTLKLKNKKQKEKQHKKLCSAHCELVDL